MAKPNFGLLKVNTEPAGTPVKTNPILKFAAENPATPAIGGASSENPILKFAGQQQSALAGGAPSASSSVLFGEDAQYVPKNYDEARKLQEENPSMWQRISKQLMKPIGTVATTIEDAANFGLNAIDGDKNTSALDVLKKYPGRIGGVLSGTRETSFSDLWRDYGAKAGVNPVVSTIAGLVVDIAADPLNFIGGGLTKLGSITSKVEALNKAKQTIVAGSKLDKEMKALGLTPELLKLAPTKVEQVQQGQRAMLSLFANTRFEKTLLKGESFYRATNALKNTVKSLPVVTRVGQVLQKVFSTKTTNEAFNTAKNHFDNLMEYRKGKVMEEAIDLQNNIAQLGQGDALRMIDVIETGKKTGVPAIDNLASRVTASLKEIHKAEDALGLVKSEIQDYFPHIKVKEDLSISERIARMFNSPKKYSTALGSSKERQILKFASEAGDDIPVGKADVLGLRKINSEKLISRVEQDTAKLTAKLQKIQSALAKPEVSERTADLQDIIKTLRENVSSSKGAISETLDEPTAKEFGDVIESLIGPERQRLELLIKELEQQVMTTQGDEFLKTATKATKASREAKIVKLQKEIMDIQAKAGEKIKKLQFFDYVNKEGKLYKSIKHGGEFMDLDKAGVNEINEMFGTNFFESRPAVAYAQRALGSAKAVTSQEFFNTAKQFAIDTPEAVETGLKGMEGLKFAPDVAAQLTSYDRALKNDIPAVVRLVDSVQNWWKSQALLAPSYHIRNSAGNIWNNFLAGVKDPKAYMEAGMVQKGKAVNFVDDIGRKWNTPDLIEAAKKSGVIDQGWFAKDVEQAVDGAMSASWNPFKQNFRLFDANRKAGQAVENNARLAHFITRLKEGSTIEDAAMSVKKFLFDYSDLTAFEKGFMKRVMPFYTWTRKNIPIQLEELFAKNPLNAIGAAVGGTAGFINGLGETSMDDPFASIKGGISGAAILGSRKVAGVGKAQNAIESTVPETNEKYLGDYIRDNVGVRVGTDKENNTYYFLLGNWLPAAQAIDFLSQPVENFTMMVSPFVKVPIEEWANQSSFFEDSFGQPSKIERYPEENQSFLGLTMRKKTSYILKNVRILNELDKLNPGAIFGDKENPSLWNRIAPEAGFRLPGGIGTITTSEQRNGRYTPETGQGGRILQSLFGKLTPYNPRLGRKFYLWDTETKVRELERGIKDARRDGQDEYAKRMREELKKIKKER